MQEWRQWKNLVGPWFGVRSAGLVPGVFASAAASAPRRLRRPLPAFRAAAGPAAAALVLLAAAVPAFGQPAREAPLVPLAPAGLPFDPELIDWASLYANPVLELEPVGFGAVAFERRSFLRTVSSFALLAAGAYGAYSGLRRGADGGGWGRSGVVVGVSAVGVVAAVQGLTRWSKTPSMRRVGW